MSSKNEPKQLNDITNHASNGLQPIISENKRSNQQAPLLATTPTKARKPAGNQNSFKWVWDWIPKGSASTNSNGNSTFLSSITIPDCAFQVNVQLTDFSTVNFAVTAELLRLMEFSQFLREKLLEKATVEDPQSDEIYETIQQLQVIPVMCPPHFSVSPLLFHSPNFTKAMINLTRISIVKHSIKEIPKELCHLSNLQILSFSHNHIKTLPNELEQLASSLIELNLDNNKLDKFPPVLSKLTKLEILHLEHNKIPTLPLEINTLTKLRFLSLNDNILSVVAPEISALLSLDSLNLSHNFLKALPTTMEKLANLTYLNLSDNRLFDICNINWKPLETSLITLDLSRNILTRLPDSICSFERLVELFASDNGLLSLPTNFGAGGVMQSLRKLDLSSNKKLDSLPKSIGQLGSSLNWLDLSGNNLNSLPLEFSQLESLQFLNISSNKFAQLPEFFWNGGWKSESLRTLIFSGNQLKEIPDNFPSSFPNLEELRLDANQLQTVPSTIGNFRDLRILDLNDNPNFQSLPLEIEKIVQLRRLKLHNVPKLKDLPSTFVSLKHLMELSLFNVSIVCKQESHSDNLLLINGNNSATTTTTTTKLKDSKDDFKKPNPLNNNNNNNNNNNVLTNSGSTIPQSQPQQPATTTTTEVFVMQEDVVQLRNFFALVLNSPHHLLIEALCHFSSQQMTTGTLRYQEHFLQDGLLNQLLSKLSISTTQVITFQQQQTEKQQQQNTKQEHKRTNSNLMTNLENGKEENSSLGLWLQQINACMMILRNLSQFDIFQEKLFSEKAFDVLLAFIFNAKALSSSSLQSLAIETLGNCCFHEPCREAVCSHESYDQTNLLDQFRRIVINSETDISVKKMTKRLLAIFGVHSSTLSSQSPSLSENKEERKSIRILCLDGGGIRGLVTLAILRKLEQLTQKRIFDLFDIIGGTSTGGLLATLIGVRGRSLDDCEAAYLNLGNTVLKHTEDTQSGWSMSWARLNAGLNMVRTGAYYNSQPMEDLIQKEFFPYANNLLIDSNALDQPGGVKPVFVVSTCVSSNPPEPYLFRNYQFPVFCAKSRYIGSCRETIVKAIRATTAAPGYFDEVVVNYPSGIQLRLQDGGFGANNCTNLGIHEAKKLFPHSPIGVIVSIGTGRAARKTGGGAKSIQGTLQSLIDVVTDTERIDEILSDLIHPQQYFRFNPIGDAFVCALDETNKKRIEALQQAAVAYTETPQVLEKLKQLATVLTFSHEQHSAQNHPSGLSLVESKQIPLKTKASDVD